MDVAFRVFSNKIKHLKHRKAQKDYNSLRISVGTRINRNKITHNVLKISMIKSRLDGYSVGQIATAYKVSTRTAWNNIKHLDMKPTFFKYSSMVKLYLRSILTTKWIRWLLKHKNGTLTQILEGIEQESKPP